MTAATREVADTIVIALVVLFNTPVGVRQEIDADRAIDALQGLSSPRVRVIRDNAQAVLRGEELVVGDLVLLGG